MGSSRDVLARLPERALALPGAPGAAGADAPVSSAASVILLRDSGGLLETWLMRRHRGMAVSPGFTVFPGGRLEPVDELAADPLRACAVRELAEETSVIVPPGDLVPWARWITPVHRPRRFDTWFYLAAMPGDATATDVSGEADRAYWLAPKTALAQAEAGELALMLPTLAALTELADHADLASLFSAAAGRVIETVAPAAVQDGERWSMGFG